jgi:transposase
MNPKEGIVRPSDYPSDEELFQDMLNEEARTKAYVRYMQEQSPQEIAAEIGVSVQVVRRWIVKDRWSERLRQVRQQRVEEEQIALDVFRGTNRLTEIQEQLKAGRSGRELVQRMLDDGGLNSSQIKQLADALRAFSDVAARAVGVGEVVEQKNTDGDGAGGGGKIRPPQVVIVAGDGARVQVKE